jgi:hypothetical protein
VAGGRTRWHLVGIAAVGLGVVLASGPAQGDGPGYGPWPLPDGQVEYIGTIPDGQVPTLPVTLRGPQGSRAVLAALDTGATGIIAQTALLQAVGAQPESGVFQLSGVTSGAGRTQLEGPVTVKVGTIPLMGSAGVWDGLNPAFPEPLILGITAFPHATLTVHWTPGAGGWYALRWTPPGPVRRP